MGVGGQCLSVRGVAPAPHPHITGDSYKNGGMLELHHIGVFRQQLLIGQAVTRCLRTPQ
jgi:hypothetical protein